MARLMRVPWVQWRRFRVEGRVREEGSRRALPGLLVRAFGKDLLADDHLGDALTRVLRDRDSARAARAELKGPIYRRGMRRILIAAVLLLVVIQFVPVSPGNPPVEGRVPAPPQVAQILERACYDCHSHETKWPWYAKVAPVSWLMAYDVTHAREHLNFSTWNRYDAKKQQKKLGEIWEEVEEDEMPPAIYRPMHPEAALSAEDKALLHAWAVPAKTLPAKE